MLIRNTGRYFAAFSKPFALQFGRLVERIKRLQQCIEDDARAGALVMQLVQHKSLAQHRVDSYLRRNRESWGPLFLFIKTNLPDTLVRF